jgi:hypothetical protein
MMGQIQYICDENQTITAVIVPIELWRELQAEKETAYLLKSETMKRRLLTAKSRKEGISFTITNRPQPGVPLTGVRPRPAQSRRSQSHKKRPVVNE